MQKKLLWQLYQTWYYPTGLKSLPCLLFISLLIAGSGLLVFYTGGIKYVFSHSMYIPIIFAALLFGTKGGIISGLVGGLVLGPFMPIDTLTGEMQLAVNWLFRTSGFVFVGSLSGYTIQSLRQAEAEQKVLLQKAKASEQKAAETACQLGNVLERVKDGFVALDKNWYYSYVNSHAAKMLQRDKPEDLIGKHIWTEYPEGVDQPFFQAYYRAMETQEPQYLEEHYEPWDLWFENRIYPSPEGLTIYFTDITERRLAEVKLKQWHELMQYIIRFDPNSIAMLNLNLEYIFVSDRFLKDYQLKTSDVIGKHHYDIFPEIPERWKRVHQRALAGEVISADEDYLTRGDGSTDFIRWQCRPWYQKDNTIGGIILYTEVITERKLTEIELERLNEELEQRVAERTTQLAVKNRELEAFAYTVSHDLKAPLRGIDGYSRMILEDYLAKLDESGRAHLQAIRNLTVQMNRLIDDLLAYTRLEQRSWQSRTVDVSALTQTVLSSFTSELAKNKIQLACNIADLRITADPDGLSLIIRNLVDNAIKFSLKNKDTDTRIVIRGILVDDSIVLSVHDNGPGFDMTHHEHIFGIFNRLHHHEENPGTGIGLALVRKAAERMGGRVWAESAPGQGATFYLQLPGEAVAR